MNNEDSTVTLVLYILFSLQKHDKTQECRGCTLNLIETSPVGGDDCPLQLV